MSAICMDVWEDGISYKRFPWIIEGVIMLPNEVSICFTEDGIINPTTVERLQKERPVDTFVLVGNGTEKALDLIKNFEKSLPYFSNKIKRVGIAKVPRFDLRVKSKDGSISLPHYVYDEMTKIKWMCAKVAAPHLQISIFDITSKSNTQVDLTPELVETTCFLGYELWNLLLIAQDRLCFPAVVIDKMTRWTYNLTKETIDIELLRKETGFESLSYHYNSDMLTVEVLEERFDVKLSLLNEVYGSLILPFFNKLYGRRRLLEITHEGDINQSVTRMGFGELGRIVHDMCRNVIITPITTSRPMEAIDLLAFSKKVRTDEEQSCFWMDDENSLSSICERERERILSFDHQDDSEDQSYPE